MSFVWRGASKKARGRDGERHVLKFHHHSPHSIFNTAAIVSHLSFPGHLSPRTNTQTIHISQLCRSISCFFLHIYIQIFSHIVCRFCVNARMQWNTICRRVWPPCFLSVPMMILPFVQRVPSSSEVFYFCTFCHEHTLQLVCFSLFYERLIIIIIISCDQFLFKYYIKLVTNVLRPSTQAWDCRNSQLVLSMFLFRFATVGVFSHMISLVL